MLVPVHLLQRFLESDEHFAFGRHLFHGNLPRISSMEWTSPMKSTIPLIVIGIIKHPFRSTRNTDSDYPSATSNTIITLNPTAKNTVPRLECCPCDISGISSSTTT